MEGVVDAIEMGRIGAEFVLGDELVVEGLVGISWKNAFQVS
jgi:hypothetical protein